MFIYYLSPIHDKDNNLLIPFLFRLDYSDEKQIMCAAVESHAGFKLPTEVITTSTFNSCIA